VVLAQFQTGKTHEEREVEPGGLVLPLGHGVHAFPDKPNVPAEHVQEEREVEPGGLVLPLGHGVHAFPDKPNVPARHG
jgi:hypothetical protein